MRANKETPAGRRYLELQREARRAGRPTDELIQLYALECFLDRLMRSEFAENFVLKGGVLLAALGARRPTRDIDFAARAIDNDTQEVLRLVRRIAACHSTMALSSMLPTPPRKAFGPTLKESMSRVARYREVTLSPLKAVLEGYEEIAQSRFVSARRPINPQANQALPRGVLDRKISVAPTMDWTD